jgi:hypothetical protein
MVTEQGGSDALGPQWTVRVELQDRASRTYVGWVSTREGSQMYERSKEAVGINRTGRPRSRN